MGRNLDSKCSRCRRAGEKLFLKGDRCFTPKCAIIKRNYIPGQHGPSHRSGRMTEYGMQLKEKQKVKLVYGVMEKQFSNYVKEAMRKQGDSGENLMKLLEMRLDNIVYRMGLAKSRSIARQLVNHRQVAVNKRIVNIPSAQVKVGAEIYIPEKSKKLFSDVAKSGQKQKTPGWISFEPKELKGKVLSVPPLEEIKQGIDVPLIIEFYSR